MDEIRISVRRLVEFILREGDIDSGTGRPDRDAMQMGSRLHRKIQGKGGADYRAEVSLKRSFSFPGGAFDRERLKMPAAETGALQEEGFSILLEGRADGIIRKKDGYVIDEIKGMLRDVEELEGPYAVHEAQASCYAYLYLRQLKEEGAARNSKAAERNSKAAEGDSKSAAGRSKAKERRPKDTEDKIAYARQFYNDDVKQYKNKIEMFPSNIVAGMAGFHPMPYYEIDESERENVSVKF